MRGIELHAYIHLNIMTTRRVGQVNGGLVSFELLGG